MYLTFVAPILVFSLQLIIHGAVTVFYLSYMGVQH